MAASNYLARHSWRLPLLLPPCVRERKLRAESLAAGGGDEFYFAEQATHAILGLISSPREMFIIQFFDCEGLAFHVAVADAVAPIKDGLFGADFGELAGEFRRVGDFNEFSDAPAHEPSGYKSDTGFHRRWLKHVLGRSAQVFLSRSRFDPAR